MRRNLLEIALLLFTVLIIQSHQTAFAQNSVIHGKIKTDLPYAPIVHLHNAADSSVVKSTICDSLGNYEFDHLKVGAYRIYLSEEGYEEINSSVYEITADPIVITVPDIEMNPLINQLQDVTITAKVPFIERKIDRVVVNPDAMIGNAGATALDVLEKSPGVMVDFEGNISLKGKPGVLVYIDNKPTYMSSTDLAGYLRSLPSGSIASIEIMNNPPAEYDAAGNAGIINIKLKKNKAKGVNGGINVSYGQGRYLRTNNSFNINYRVNKVNFFGSLAWSQNNMYQDLTINRYYFKPDGTFSSSFLQHSYIKKEFGGRNARFGMDWYVSDKSTIGVVVSGFMNPSWEETTNYANIQDSTNATISQVTAYGISDSRWKNGSANVNYALKIDSLGRELTFNADYIAYTSDQLQSLDNSVRATDNNNTLLSAFRLESTLPAQITIKTAKIDYVHPIEGFGTIDFGMKTAFVNTDNTASFFNIVNDSAIPNYTFSNRFLYNENNNAVYTNYSRNWSKIALQLGLRMESITMKGHQLGNPEVSDSSFVRKYTSFFPTVYFSYTPDSAQFHQFGLSAGRRIDYPNYQDMNPFTYPMDAYTYYAGNPFLKPTFSYNIELSHTYKNMVTTTVDYSIVYDLIQETNEQVNTIYYSRPGNFGQQSVYGVSVNGNFELTKWWTFQVYSEYKNIGFKTTIYGQDLNEDRWYWYVGPTTRFVLSPKVSAELGGSYQTRILVGQFLTIPVGQVRAGVAVKVLKDKGVAKFNLSDVFYTNQPGGDIRNIAQSKANWLSYLDTRVATVSFSYRFNKGKSLNARQSGSSDDEKERVITN